MLTGLVSRKRKFPSFQEYLQKLGHAPKSAPMDKELDTARILAKAERWKALDRQRES